MPKPFPVPVVAALPNPLLADGEEHLDYLTMPQGMDTYRAPPLPEPEALAGHRGALQRLQAVRAALAQAVAGGQPAPVSLAGLDEADLALVQQLLGEGEVSAQVLPAPGCGQAQMQESVFAGVWRVLQVGADGQVIDQIEVGAVPSLLLQAAADDARAATPTLGTASAADIGPPDAAAHGAGQTPPPGVMNAQPVLAELAEHRTGWQPGQPARVVNFSLLPLTPTDIAWIDHCLGTGRVLILSRGYGNCRITSTRVRHTWRLVYYNSQDSVILNTADVCAMPEAACAAAEDLADSLQRLDEVLQWVQQA